MQATADTALVQAERVRSVFQQAPLALSVNAVNAALAAIVLEPVIDHRLLILWLAAMVGVSAVRLSIWRLFQKREPAAPEWRRWLLLGVLGSVLSGVLWGAAAVGLVPSVETYQLFLAFVIGGMSAGALAVNFAHWASVLGFMFPACLPLAARFFIDGSTPRSIAAFMIVIFAIALSLVSLRGHRSFGDRVRLQIAHGRQARELNEVNVRLRSEIAEHHATAATLQQAQKMEAIGHLTGGIAHDFNNLLMIVIGNLDLVRFAAAGNKQVIEYAAEAQHAADRGARLTASLLAFARRQSLRSEWVSANALLQDFEPIMSRALGTGSRFELNLDPNLPLCRADPAHFQSAILNLVINGRDAMPEGGQLTITSSPRVLQAAELDGNPDATPGPFVAVSVQDTGTGMTPEILARAFEPFFTTKKTGAGSGLGLSQVYGFARQSSGHLIIRSGVGAGTNATLFLPADTRPPSSAVRNADLFAQRPQLDGTSAVLVEEDAKVLDVVRSWLTDAGCRVDTAQNATEALSLLQMRGDVRVLLTNFALSGNGMTGVELAHAARSAMPNLAVVLMTGPAAEELVAQADARHEFELLRKPFRQSDLVASVREALSRPILATS